MISPLFSASSAPARPSRYAHALSTALLMGVLLVAGCQRGAEEAGYLDTVRARGHLIVATRNSPLTYYEDREGLAGFEYDMATAFAAHLGLPVTFIIMDDIGAMLAAVQAGEADFVAGGLTRTPARAQAFLFGPVYQEVQQQVVCRRGGRVPKSPAELVGMNIAVRASSSYEERLDAIRATQAELAWESVADTDTEQLLEQVWKGERDCAVADSNIVSVIRRYFPELIIAFDLGEKEALSWLLPAGATDLQAQVEQWFAPFNEGGALAALEERYFGYVDAFDFVDYRAYRNRIEAVLPRYQAMFEQAAADHQLQWTLLAAQAYQESHWNPKARSPTGVRGMMMLTLGTAKELGIASRMDPGQSIRGGAKYLRRLYDRLPETITGEDRLWFALAAYNVGYGHLQDARTLAERKGLDPNAWKDVREVLPLLTQKQYYSQLRYGYARGYEPVRYVQRIRDFHDILTAWVARQEAPAAEPVVADR